jgi:hypothetical protein
MGHLVLLLNGYTLPASLLYLLGSVGSETAIDSAATNEIMGKRIIFDFVINAEQERKN